MREFVPVLIFSISAPSLFSSPAHSKDIGDIFGKFLGGVLDQANRQQQKKRQQKRMVRQVRIDLDSCFIGKDVASCNRLLASPLLNRASKQKGLKARQSAILYWRRKNVASAPGTSTSSPLYGGGNQTEKELQTTRRELVKERARTAQLYRQISDKSSSIRSLQTRLKHLKTAFSEQTDQVRTFAIRQQQLITQRNRERLYFQLVLGAPLFACSFLLVIIRGLRNEVASVVLKNDTPPQLTNEEQASPALIEPPRLPNIMLTGHKADEFHALLHG